MNPRTVSAVAPTGVGKVGEPPAYDQPLQATRDFCAAGAERYLLGDYLAGVAFTLLLLPFAEPQRPSS